LEEEGEGGEVSQQQPKIGLTAKKVVASLSAAKASPVKSGAKRVENLSARDGQAEGNPEEEEGGKGKSCLQKFNEVTHNKWFWIAGGSILVSIIVTIVVVLNFVVLLPKATVMSSSQNILPRTGEAMITKTVAVKDVNLFSPNS
jgi:hypothetical protein